MCYMKGLIVDQTIEKVSFCAPDRNSERGFAYICRDGTSRRWMCHGFFALKETVIITSCFGIQFVYLPANCRGRLIHHLLTHLSFAIYLLSDLI